MINGFEEEQIEVDYCNEFLAIRLLETSILSDTNQFGQAVNRVRLNRTQQNDLDNRFFHSDEILVEKWSSDLPGLKKFKWNRLDKRMFQHLVNLEEFKLWRMYSAKVDFNTFAFNKNLKKLTITVSVLSLNSQSFNGLVNLTELDLSLNRIVALPDGLFDSCTALRVVDLSRNILIKFETSTFQNLVNLEELYLSSNFIKEIDSYMFRCNKKLIKLGLNNNKISKLNKDFFRGLCQLTHLHLAYNEIVSLPEGPFDSCLQMMNFSHNKLINLETSLFNSLVNLTRLDLSNNEIMSLPDGIFQNLTNLKYLNISHIKISELPNNVFDSLINLKNLDLGENEITNIPNGLFDNLISLRELNLRRNKIEFQEDSDPNIFKGLRKLTNLDIGNNQINILPEGIFKNLVSLEELRLEKNYMMSLPKGFFKDLDSLKRLWLAENAIETEDGNFLYIEMKNVKPVPEHIEIDLSDYDDSNDQDSTDEIMNEQNNLEAFAKDTEKRYRDCQENVGETLNVLDDESNPKRFNNKL